MEASYSSSSKKNRVLVVPLFFVVKCHRRCRGPFVLVATSGAGAHAPNVGFGVDDCYSSSSLAVMDAVA